MTVLLTALWTPQADLTMSQKASAVLEMEVTAVTPVQIPEKKLLLRPLLRIVPEVRLAEIPEDQLSIYWTLAAEQNWDLVAVSQLHSASM